MPVTIENMTNRPVLLRFTSGATAWVAAGEKLANIVEADIKDNVRIRKLEARKVIKVHPEKPASKSRKK